MMTTLNQVGTALTDIEAYHGGQARPVATESVPTRVMGVPTPFAIQGRGVTYDFSRGATVNIHANRTQDERESDNAWIAGIALLILAGISAGAGAWMKRQWEERGDLEQYKRLSGYVAGDPTLMNTPLRAHFDNVLKAHRRVVENNYLWGRNVTIISLGALLGTAAAFAGFMVSNAALASFGTMFAVAYGVFGVAYITFSYVSNQVAKKPHYALSQEEQQILTDARSAYSQLAPVSYSAEPRQVPPPQGGGGYPPPAGSYQPPVWDPHAGATAPPADEK